MPVKPADIRTRFRPSAGRPRTRLAKDNFPAGLRAITDADAVRD
jgi:hypothetical protein